MAVPVMSDSASVTGRAGGKSHEQAESSPIQHLLELARNHELQLHDLRVEHDALRAEVESLRRMLQVVPRRSSKEDVSSVSSLARRSLGSSASSPTTAVVKVGGFQRQTKSSVQRHSSPHREQQIVPLSKPAFKAGQALARRQNPNLGPTLRAAVEAGNDDAVRRLLSAQANPEDCDDKGVSTLHMASFHGKESVCRSLLKAKASANVSDQHGQSPLFFAPSTSICEVLFEQHADVNVVNNKGQSALHFAGQAGMAEVFQWVWVHMNRDLLDSQDAYNANGIYYARAAGVKEELLSKLQPRNFSPNERGASVGRLATVLEEDVAALSVAVGSAGSGHSASRGRYALEDRPSIATDGSHNRKARSPARVAAHEGATVALGKLSMARAAKAKAASMQRSLPDALRRGSGKASPQQGSTSPLQFSPRSLRGSIDNVKDSARRELEYDGIGSPDSPEQSVKESAARCIQAVYRAHRETDQGHLQRPTTNCVSQVTEVQRRSAGGGGVSVSKSAAKAKAAKTSQGTPPRQAPRSMQKACHELREITKQDVRERQLRIQRARGQTSGVLPGEIDSSFTTESCQATSSATSASSGPRSARTSERSSEHKPQKVKEKFGELNSEKQNQAMLDVDLMSSGDFEAISPPPSSPEEGTSGTYEWKYPSDLIGRRVVKEDTATPEQQSKVSSPGGDELELEKAAVTETGNSSVSTVVQEAPLVPPKDDEEAVVAETGNSPVSTVVEEAPLAPSKDDEEVTTKEKGDSLVPKDGEETLLATNVDHEQVPTTDKGDSPVSKAEEDRPSESSRHQEKAATVETSESPLSKVVEETPLATAPDHEEEEKNDDREDVVGEASAGDDLFQASNESNDPQEDAERLAKWGLDPPTEEDKLPNEGGEDENADDVQSEPRQEVIAMDGLQTEVDTPA